MQLKKAKQRNARSFAFLALGTAVAVRRSAVTSSVPQALCPAFSATDNARHAAANGTDGR